MNLKNTCILRVFFMYLNTLRIHVFFFRPDRRTGPLPVCHARAYCRVNTSTALYTPTERLAHALGWRSLPAGKAVEGSACLWWRELIFFSSVRCVTVCPRRARCETFIFVGYSRKYVVCCSIFFVVHVTFF